MAGVLVLAVGSAASATMPKVTDKLYFTVPDRNEVHVYTTTWKGAKKPKPKLSNVIRSPKLKKGPTEIAVGKDTGIVLVSKRKSVAIIDTATDTITAKVKIGKKARDVAISPNGTDAFVLHGKRFVTHLDLSGATARAGATVTKVARYKLRLKGARYLAIAPSPDPTLRGQAGDGHTDSVFTVVVTGSVDVMQAPAFEGAPIPKADWKRFTPSKHGGCSPSETIRPDAVHFPGRTHPSLLLGCREMTDYISECTDSSCFLFPLNGGPPADGGNIYYNTGCGDFGASGILFPRQELKPNIGNVTSTFHDNFGSSKKVHEGAPTSPVSGTFPGGAFFTSHPDPSRVASSLCGGGGCDYYESGSLFETTCVR